MVQLSQPHLTTEKTIALTIQTFVGRVMSLLFSTLSWIVIAFQPRSNCLLFLWMQSLSSVIFEPKKRKSFCGKLLKGWEYQTTLSVSLETCLRVKKQQLECYVEQQSGSGWRKYDKVTTEFSTVCYDPHKGFSVVDETEVDVFLKFPCFLCDPANVGNLISGSSTFSKPSLDIWTFLVHIILRPSMQDFKHDLTSLCCCSVAQSCLTLCDPMD